MGPYHAASAMRGNSRQTDLEHPFAFGLRGFATLRDVCLSPASHGSNVLENEMFPDFSALPPGRHNRLTTSICGVRTALGRIGGGFVELAVERRAADLQPARDLRHLTAIMRDRKADDFVFHLLERPHFAG